LDALPIPCAVIGALHFALVFSDFAAASEPTLEALAYAGKAATVTVAVVGTAFKERSL